LYFFRARAQRDEFEANQGEHYLAPNRPQRLRAEKIALAFPSHMTDISVVTEITVSK
jgi:hypothetical protein